jgi:hypothetical protein
MPRQPDNSVCTGKASLTGANDLTYPQQAV